MDDERNSFLVDGKYSIRDLVDIDRLREIMERFTKVTGFTIGFLDHPEMNVLIATGWRDICTKFHRGFSCSAEICKISNHRLLFGLKTQGQLLIEECENGLIDCATPIIIKGTHIASLATGQFLFEKPDVESFRLRAKKFGYDEVQYLKALEEIPVVSKTQVMDATAFLGSLAVVISEMGYVQLGMKEEASRLGNEILQRNLVTEKLRESEEKYRALVDTTDTGYVILDRHGIVLEANQEYVRLTGHKCLEEIIGRRVTDWTAPHDRDRNAEQVQKCFGNGSVRHLEIDYIDKQGIIIPVEIDATRVPEEKIVSLIRDISGRKKAEENRLKMERQIVQVQKLESLGLLAGGIAHDFNNLMQGVIGNADLALMDSTVSEITRESLTGIISAGRQAADLCRQLLAYSGKGRFVLRKLNLKDLVQEMGSILEISISKKISLRYCLDDPLPPFEGDPSQIRQVLMNLIINASEAIGDNIGTIKISVDARDWTSENLRKIEFNDLAPGRYLILEVKDSGCGMDNATCSQVFDPFFSTKKTGRGLGLSAVQGIVRSHKGRIRVDSEKGQGTSFLIMFPAVKGVFDDFSEINPEEVKWQKSGTVLFADDLESVRSFGKKVLEHLGFKVILAQNGNEAVELFYKSETTDQEPIVCAILDLSMPVKDGIEAFREIRRLRPEIPIIISSGYDEQDVVLKLVREEHVGFIKKPYEVKEIISKLKEILHKEH
ncbi:MAG: PocR ligand-binding domain-containing protein [Candidatus Riflebacteria bacterium]|nr:PocR ligand-binding domain-containing protein [Candidatus Riflebacteria bacterium]